MRGCFDSVTAGPEINPVCIKLDNLLLGEFALDAERHHCLQYFSTKSAATERETVTRQLHRKAARAFLGRPARDITNQSAQNSAPINPLMFVEPGVLARQHRIDEIRGDFAQRDLEPVRAGQATVNFPINIVNGVSLRHFANVLHVEGLRPCSVKEEDREAGGRQQNKQGDFPAVAKKKVPARFVSRSKKSEKFHRLENKTI